MAKIDYSKAEREMHQAIQRMRVKNLAEGKSVTSKRAAEYYGLQEPEPRPTPEEPVARLVREEAALEEISAQETKQPLPPEVPSPGEGGLPEQQRPEEPSGEFFLGEDEDKEIELATVSEFEEEPAFETITEPPVYDVLRKARKQSERPPKFTAAPPPDVPPSDTFFEPASHLYILRQHILWLKRRHYDNRYELLGTTRDEVMGFRRAKRLTDDQLARIKELNARAEEVKASILTDEGLHTEEAQIEAEQERHKTKRLNVKDTWLPL